MHQFPNTNYNSVLPPGKYKYSKDFPAMMNQLSPVYTVPAEPVFLDNLLMNVGKTIRVVTINGTIEGKLTGAAIDHIQLTVGNVNYHIRIQHISYFIGKP